MFTAEERDRVRDRVVEMARADPRVTAGALTGSTAFGAGDEWSDIDVAFGIVDSVTPEDVLDDWTEVLTSELGALDHWDLRAGSWVYRVFLLPSGLEVDIGVAPEKDFGSRGPRFRALFGNPRQLDPPPPPDARHTVGLGWHHVLHARVCIERGKPWQAEYWISAVRDYTLTLASIRLGEEASYARGADRLPDAVTGPLKGALVRSLDEAELRRALGVATACFIREVEVLDAELCGRLKPVLEEFGDVR
jgi:predicted nucleotidyltransferase